MTVFTTDTCKAYIYTPERDSAVLMPNSSDIDGLFDSQSVGRIDVAL